MTKKDWEFVNESGKIRAYDSAGGIIGSVKDRSDR